MVYYLTKKKNELRPREKYSKFEQKYVSHVLEYKHTLSQEGKELQLADDPNAEVLLPSEWTLNSSEALYINYPFGA